MKTIHDPSFRYTASYKTDLRKTFARIRRVNQNAADKREPVPPAASMADVTLLIEKVAGRRS
jgi:hypothetical protein